MNTPTALVLALAAAALCFAAASPDARKAAQSSKVIYGQDGRMDYYQLSSNDPYRTLMEESIVALMRPSTIGSPSNGQYSFLDSYTSVGWYQDLCSSEPFREDPAAAFCSGTLVGNDRVVTAGHCLDASDCYNVRFVFKYYVTSRSASGVPTFPTITEDDVYSCANVESVLDEYTGMDYAVVHLDRNVDSSKTPVTASTTEAALSNGQSLVLVGCPTGMPFKVDKGGVVVNNRASDLLYFQATVDSYGGNSGSGVFDSSQRHIGILVRGATDYVETGASCQVSNVISNCNVGSSTCGESVTYAFHANTITDCLTSADCSTGRTCSTYSCSSGTTNECKGFCTEPNSAGTISAALALVVGVLVLVLF